MGKLYLLDAYALIYRAYYALIRAPRFNSKGLNTSAIFGFVNTLEEIRHRSDLTHIGVAFDGNIESLSSDFKYNPQLQRCINADIRYVLWTLDTFGGSSYLLKELDIRK